MKYKPLIWIFMTRRLKKGLPTCWPGDVIKNLFVRAKPIYKDLLSKMKGLRGMTVQTLVCLPRKRHWGRKNTYLMGE